ncbi:MAG: ABC transporter substrate-binding protein, partial [Boseongicola sp.]
MHSIFRASLTALVTSAAMAGGAIAGSHSLSGDLKIFLDTSNPAPRATMEAMIGRFQEMHPDLNIETTVIDREAYKTQIRNFLTANAPDVATWYAANRMSPYVNAGLFEDVSDLWNEPEIAENLASTKGAMTIDGKQWGVPYTYYQWG